METWNEEIKFTIITYTGDIVCTYMLYENDLISQDPPGFKPKNMYQQNFINRS